MLMDLDPRAGRAELGIVIGEAEYRGKGFGTDACNAIIDFAFGELRLERVQLRTRVDNPAARLHTRNAASRRRGLSVTLSTRVPCSRPLSPCRYSPTSGGSSTPRTARHTPTPPAP